MKMTIYIPEEIAAQIRETRGEHNWSQIAQEAFSKHLGKVTSADNDPDIAAAVARLRTKREELYRNGREKGRKWVRDHASREELLKVEQWYKENGSNMALAPSAEMLLYGFLEEIVARSNKADEVEERFNQGVKFFADLDFGCEALDPMEAVGIIVGAVEFWRVIRDRLEVSPE